MKTSGSVKMLIIAATAGLSVGAVAVPKTFVASVPGGIDTGDAVKTVSQPRKMPTLTFVRPVSPGPHVCEVQLGGKVGGRSMPVRSPACAFLADL